MHACTDLEWSFEFVAAFALKLCERVLDEMLTANFQHEIRYGTLLTLKLYTWKETEKRESSQTLKERRKAYEKECGAIAFRRDCCEEAGRKRGTRWA
jgi:nucleoside phosphorylase